jgi:hypothetical protein
MSSVIEKIDPAERKRLVEMRNLCRLRRHWMDTFTPVEFEKTGAFIAATQILHWRCEACHTVRHDAIDRVGGLLARRYEYPDGYRLDTDEERPTADDLRMWMIKRNRALGIRQPPTKAKVNLSVSEQLRQSAR